MDPVIVNILLYHFLLSPAGAGLAIFVTILWGFLFFSTLLQTVCAADLLNISSNIPTAMTEEALGRLDATLVFAGGGRGYSVQPLLVRQSHKRPAANRLNLHRLLAHHVPIALGSDSYRQDTLREAQYIESLPVVPRARLLKMWTKTTAETIFPARHIGP